MLTFRSVPPSALARIGRISERNKIIHQIITKRRLKAVPTLVFACDTFHAERLAVQWRKKGITARAITAKTPRALRHKWVQAFKQGELEILVNYGVLTTGFDAPNLQRVIMARPTTSGVLFEQMVGRGLRGPKFGGTERCTVFDLVDVFRLHGGMRGFQKWERDWLKGKRPKRRN